MLLNRFYLEGCYISAEIFATKIAERVDRDQKRNGDLIGFGFRGSHERRPEFGGIHAGWGYFCEIGYSESILHCSRQIR